MLKRKFRKFRVFHTQIPKRAELKERTMKVRSGAGCAPRSPFGYLSMEDPKRLPDGLERPDLVRVFPGELRLAPAKVAIGCGLRIDRAQEIQRLDDACRAE